MTQRTKGANWSIRSAAILLAAGLVACLTFAQERGRDTPDSSGEARSAQAMSHRIVRTLNSPFTVDFTDISLRDALDKIEERNSIPIWIDVNRLSEAGIDLNQSVNLQLTGTSLRSTLRLLLEPLGLTYIIADGVLKIVTNEAANERMLTRVYPIRDLVSDDDPNECQKLMRAVQKSTPGNWEDPDGEGGTISAVLKGHAIVIRQTFTVHRAIDGVLTAIRKAENLPRINSIPTDLDDVDELWFETTEVRRGGERNTSSPPKE